MEYNVIKKFNSIISQLKEFKSKPNGGIIKIILIDGSTVIGLFKNVEFKKGIMYVNLSNGRKVVHNMIEKIV
jgi:hypothetical protein